MLHTAHATVWYASKTREAWVPMMISKASRFSLNIGGVLSIWWLLSQPCLLTTFQSEKNRFLLKFVHFEGQYSTKTPAFWFQSATLDIQTPAEEGIWSPPKIYLKHRSPHLRRYDWMSRATFCSFAFNVDPGLINPLVVYLGGSHFKGDLSLEGVPPLIITIGVY